MKKMSKKIMNITIGEYQAKIFLHAKRGKKIWTECYLKKTDEEGTSHLFWVTVETEYSTLNSISDITFINHRIDNDRLKYSSKDKFLTKEEFTSVTSIPYSDIICYCLTFIDNNNLADGIIKKLRE